MVITSYLRSLYLISIIYAAVVESFRLRFRAAGHKSNVFQVRMSADHFDFLVVGGGSGMCI